VEDDAQSFEDGTWLNPAGMEGGVLLDLVEFGGGGGGCIFPSYRADEESSWKDFFLFRGGELREGKSWRLGQGGRDFFWAGDCVHDLL
jgi:hypothetical protein